MARRTLMVVAALAMAGGFASGAQAGDVVSPQDPSAIIGGEPVASCEWPSTVFLENCTGTLIHPEIVVYAAHCGSAQRVWFAESMADGVPTPPEGFSVETESCWTNPDFEIPGQDIGPYRAADYAFCKLAEPVLDVPIVPALAGCETTVLTSNTPVTLVGFGGTDQETFGVKFKVDTVLHYIDDWGVAVIGGGGQSPCAGDSGGPAFVQLPDGSWRAFGIVSGPNVGNCGDAMWFPTIHSAIPDIERESGIDVTPCHHGGNGQWNPSPDCQGFPLEPHNGAGKTWADGCSGGPTLEWSSTCGPVFDESEDLTAPVGAIVAPEDRSRIDVPEGEETASALIVAEASDAPSGVSWVELVVNGDTVADSRLVGAPWEWQVNLPPGVLEFQARMGDWAGNESLTDAVVVGVDVDPPPAPAGGSSSTGPDAGSSDETGPTDSVGDDTGTTTDDGSTTAGDTDAPSQDEPTPSSGGCGCTTSQGGDASFLLLLALVGLARPRRGRRGAASALLSMGVLFGCGDDAGAGGGDDGSSTTGSGTTAVASTGTSGADGSTATTTTPTSTTANPSSSSGASDTTGLGCEIGTLDCVCTEDFTCNEGLGCSLNTCVECEAGAITCPCRDEGDQDGECDEGLFCFGGLCASPQPCPFLENLVCDEPEGTGVCLEGTDAFDCCATEPGVCEERSQGGRCPDGSDPDDCDTGSTGDTDTDTSSGEMMESRR